MRPCNAVQPVLKASGDVSFVTEGDAALYRRRGYWSTVETIPSLLARNAAEFPGRVALLDDDGRRLTYDELHRRSSELAAGLRNRGVAKGDVVGVQLPNRIEASVAMCGIEKAGAIVCPMVPIYRERELTYIGNKTGMKAIFVPGSYRGYDHEALALRVAAAVPSLQVVITVADQPAQVGVVTFEAMLGSGEGAAAFTDPHLDPDDIAAVLFTSGTEADPKAILHTHNTLLANNRALARILSLGDQDGVFMASPVGHGTGYGFGVRLAIYLGSKLTLLGTWDPIRAARLISEEGSAYTHGATPFVLDLLEVPGIESDYDLSTLRYFVTGGAAIPQGLCSRIQGTLGCQLLRLYGQTEGFMCTLNRPSDSLQTQETTDGSPVPGVDIHAVDENGQPVAPGTPGHAVYRGPHRCVGFLNDPDRARRAMTSDGYLRSGDLVTISEAGNVTVFGRDKEVINRGGYKYSPREIEDVLVTHPAVHRVALVKMHDARLGEKGCAFVVVKAGQSVDLESLTTYLEEKGVARFKWPERLMLIEALPMTASGKVQKFVLEAALAEPSSQATAE